MPLRFFVCKLKDVPQKGFKSFVVDGLSFPIVLAKVEDQILAVSGICPHEDISFDGGSMVDEYIICPGHGYSFDLNTGRCSHDSALTLSPYKVHLEDESVYISLRLSS